MLNGNLSDLSGLKTTAKANLLSSINELFDATQQLKNATSINDNAKSTTTTYSSSQIEAKIKASVDALVNGAPGTLDTLAELAAALTGDEGTVQALTTTVGTKVSYTEVMSLDAAAKARVLSNIGAAALAHTHAISEVTGLQAALDAMNTAINTKANAADVGPTDTDYVALFNSGVA
jgi:hypothetical protein